jgi:uncharacterized protein
MPASATSSLGGEMLVLGSDRTLWWPRMRTLFASDLHAGKAEHMRRHGLAIPGGNLAYDVRRLEDAARRYAAERLIFLGDLFHSEVNTEWDVFAAWCRAQPFAIELVRGNHDRFLPDELLLAAGVRVHVEPYYMAPFMLKHHPEPQPAADQYTLAGHLHPVYWVHGPAQDRMRVRCFWQQEQQLILPAFGSFTGGLVVSPGQNDHIYACTEDVQAIYQVR